MTLQADIECFERGRTGQERISQSSKVGNKEYQGEVNASRKSKKGQYKAELTR